MEYARWTQIVSSRQYSILKRKYRFLWIEKENARYLWIIIWEYCDSHLQFKLKMIGWMILLFVEIAHIFSNSKAHSIFKMSFGKLINFWSIVRFFGDPFMVWLVGKFIGEHEQMKNDFIAAKREAYTLLFIWSGVPSHSHIANMRCTLNSSMRAHTKRNIYLCFVCLRLWRDGETKENAVNSPKPYSMCTASI